MFKTHQYIAMILTAAILISGCDKTVDDITGTAPDVSTGIAIDFSADLNNNLGTTTRSSAETINDFLVNAFWTKAGEDSTIMPKYLVYQKENVWTYTDTLGQELKYWEAEAESYVFSAVAIDSAKVKMGTYKDKVSFGKGGKIKIEGITANANPALDWMIARTKRTQSPLADTDELLLSSATSPFSAPSIFSSPVPLNFHHLLAKVEFRIYSDGVGEKTLSPLLIELNPIYQTATFNEAVPGEWEDKGEAINRSVYNKNFTVTATSQETAQPVDSLLVIPQSLSGVKLKVTTPDYSKDFSFETSDTWERDKKYIYYLKLSEPTNVILIDVKVEDWVKLDPIDGGTVTNW